MAALNFPSSPSNGQTYTANNVTYVWNGTAWKKNIPPQSSFPSLTVAGISTFNGNINVNADLNVTGTISGSGSIPSGGIIIWSGASNAIPSGWYLCNGSNGTPNLQDRFIVGAGSGYGVGATGGSADATVLVQHSHDLPKIRLNPGNDSTIAITLGSGQSYQIGYSSSAMSTNIDTGNSSSGSATNANLPPYYALCYIMKA